MATAQRVGASSGGCSVARGIHESTMRGGPQMALYWAGKQDLSHMLLARLTKEHPDAIC
jgi:hypothetical protein